jgi:hypothetical protein
MFVDVREEAGVIREKIKIKFVHFYNTYLTATQQTVNLKLFDLCRTFISWRSAVVYSPTASLNGVNSLPYLGLKPQTFSTPTSALTAWPSPISIKTR